MDEEVEASPIARRTSWPIGLHSVDERRKKEEVGNLENFLVFGVF
jgi:hypothetical protein